MRKQINMRLPEHTMKQLDELRKATGFTLTQLIITAIGDYHRRYMASKEQNNV